MNEWFASLGAIDKMFAVVGGTASILFLLRMLLTFVGLGGEEAGDVDGDVGSSGGEGYDAGDGGDLDHAGPDSVDQHTELSFGLLTFQGLTAFLMIFGLVGLALSRGSGLSAANALLGGLLAGAGTVWVTDRMFRFFGRLQHSGNVNLQRAVGEEGAVYLTIPAQGVGKVSVSVQGHFRVLDAVSENKEEIATGERVRVTKVVNENVMVVKRI
jgi:hypothetical protein